MRARPSLRRLSLRSIAAIVGAISACDASAVCISYADPEFRHYEQLIGNDPTSVAGLVTDRLARNPQLDPLVTASLHSVQAEAFGSLERYAEARAAVQSGLALVDDKQHPAYVNLLHQGALNTYDEQSIPALIETVSAARAEQQPGSAGEACMLIGLGALEHFSGESQRASEHLTQAYRMSAGPQRKQQRVLAADVLSLVMSDEADFKQALALLQEVIDYQTEQKASFDLAVSRFLRGAILRDARDHHAALVDFEASRSLAQQLNDPLGVAYANLYMCLSNFDLNDLVEARKQCVDALAPFDTAEAIDPKKQTLAALAEIDLRENDPRAALERLDEVLNDASSDMAQVRLAAMHELRARTHAALGHYDRALADYKSYMQRTKAAMDAERAKETTALRTRFETDREIERNAFLKRELTAQSERLRWMIVAGVTSLCVIALLTVLLIANRRQKALLTRLARYDDLTDLPNRRHMLELATDALEAAERTGTPLTIAVIDLDHFKQINDRFGHAVGDFVLQEFARVCRRTIREHDAFGRWGGEEFLIVLPNTTLDIALGIVERVRAAALTIRGGMLPDDFRASMSAGLATNEGHPTRLEEIITNADAALYEAKRNGRDLVCVAPESYNSASTGIRKALKDSGIAISTGKFARVPHSR